MKIRWLEMATGPTPPLRALREVLLWLGAYRRDADKDSDLMVLELYDEVARARARRAQTPKQETGGRAMAQIGVNQNVELKLKGVGVQGGDTTLQFAGQTTWTTPDAGMLALVPDAAGLACKAVALGQVGVTEVSVQATDTKGVTFNATVTIEIAPALEDTDHVEIEVGVPVDN